MRFLAIDPGSSLGWATNADGRVDRGGLDWGTEDFHIKRGESSGNRWRRFGNWLHHASLLPSGTPVVDMIVYEVAHFMPKARYAAEIAAGMTTRLEEHAERHGIALHPVHVQTLKAFAIPKVKRKKGDPKMDRSKAAMIAAAERKLGDDACAESMSAVAYVPRLTEHEADALWLYFYCKEVLG